VRDGDALGAPRRVAAGTVSSAAATRPSVLQRVA
jgi:hypothetical protein